MGVNGDLSGELAQPVMRSDRSISYVNWRFSLHVAASDGYRNQQMEVELSEGWSELDSAGCVELLGMSAANLIKSLEASGLAVFGGDAVEGFAEAYRDIVTEPASEPPAAMSPDRSDPCGCTKPIIPDDAADTSDVLNLSTSHRAG